MSFCKETGTEIENRIYREKKIKENPKENPLSQTLLEFSKQILRDS